MELRLVPAASRSFLQGNPSAFPIQSSHRLGRSCPLLFHKRPLTLLQLRLVHRGLSTAISCLGEERNDVILTVGRTHKVSAVLFDMDGVLCNSEEPSRQAAVDLFAEMGVEVTTEDFVPFMGTGEANFLGGVASSKGVKNFDPQAAKKRFFEIYLDKYAKPDSGIGFPGALELVMQCKRNGLKVAVASSADRIKVDANLAAAGLSPSIFDAIVPADAFKNLKPAPDIFLTASRLLEVPPEECIVIEDALAGVQAAKAANMRCIAVSTTLPKDILGEAGPLLVREEIGKVLLEDILSNGLSDEKNWNSLDASPMIDNDVGKFNSSIQDDTVDPKILSSGVFQGSRRQVLRYGSLAVAVSCLLFIVTRWKAMQYASPKSILNLLFGTTDSFLSQNDGDPEPRTKQLIKYISDLEVRGSKVPEFPSKLDWLNTSPLKFSKDLRGKVVLLDFWTYCCINCMHILPDLDFLEKKYKDKPFVVIGVHSAKFDNEKDLEAIRNAVLRYEIMHPVVNDGDMYLWRELGISSWPTFVLVGPSGKILAQISGEGHRKDLDSLVEAALLFYGQKKALDEQPIPLALERERSPQLLLSPLKFPGKLAVDVLNNRLFISDSNHNRVVVTDLDGSFVLQVGTGVEGLSDGTFDSATFNRPQGLAYNPKRNVLYVADTENHALREIDFVNETVRTLAGNGTKGSDYKGGRRGNDQVLNSPWDVCFEPSNELLYIAMAGQHQIWVHNIGDGITKCFSGDGFERNLNGPSSLSTSFAQPSGLAFSRDLQEIYIADSESSSIRALELKTGGSKLLAGGDPFFSENLFKFGDQDGIGSEALLQHPLGISCGLDGLIYIADSYNHKIKRLDPFKRQVVTLVGTGKAGFKDGPGRSAQLSEPSGIVEVSTGKFLVADTNNSLIRCLDLNGKEPILQTLELKGVQPPSLKPTSMKRLRRRSSVDTRIIAVQSTSSKEGNLKLKILVPQGYHFSKEARSKFEVDVEPEDALVVQPLEGFLNQEGYASLFFKRALVSPAKARVNCKVYFCKEDEVCLYQSVTFDVPFEGVTEGTNEEVLLSTTVKPRFSSGSLQPALAS